MFTTEEITETSIDQYTTFDAKLYGLLDAYQNTLITIDEAEAAKKVLKDLITEQMGGNKRIVCKDLLIEKTIKYVPPPIAEARKLGLVDIVEKQVINTKKAKEMLGSGVGKEVTYIKLTQL